MTEAADQTQRDRALDTSRSFIVQAPAGSGKTELLTQRYLALLARVEQPEEVVAITFTNKAAAEMRNRVLAALDRAASEPRPVEGHAGRTWDLAARVLEHDRRQGWSLRRQPNRLRVRTIDALCTGITRQMPLAAKLGVQPETVPDAGALYRQAARNTLAELESGETAWAEPVGRLLEHLGNDLAAVEDMLARMLARRDQWLRHMGSGCALDREALEGALYRVVADAMAGIDRRIPLDLRLEWLELARFAAGQLERRGGAGDLARVLELERFPGDAPEQLPDWLALIQGVLTQDARRPKWRTRVDVRNGFPKKDDGRDADEEALFDDMKGRHKALVDALAAIPGLRETLHGLRRLPPVRYQERQWQVLEALSVLLPLAVAHLKLVFAARGQADFAEIALSAVAALGEPDAPTDLALALDYRIQHLLVDEFQDTSLSQYELLERLTAGWQPGDGRTLFAVGDPMQSIYRFRQAEVGLFLRARREGIGQLRLEPLTLEVNFRSQRGIVDWVNAAFRRVLPEREDIAGGAVAYAPSTAFHPPLPGEAVQVHPFLGDDREEEARRVLELVRQARAEDPQQSIAILVRSRSHLAAIVPRLREAGLRYRAVEIETLGHRPVVQDLLVLTRALCHPADRVAWLALLRAPWCGLSLADLHGLAAGDGAPLWQNMRDAGRLASLSEDGRRRLRRLEAVLETALKDRRRRSLRRWVEGVWFALGGPACYAQATDLEDARVYLQTLDEFDLGGDLADFEALADKVDALYAQPDLEADDRLQIMTIHKSKGLEFDTVILPGLGRRPPAETQQLLMWLERPRPGGGDDLLLAPVKAREEDKDPIYDYLRGLDAAKRRYEDGRLLYVAATRAVRRLHLLAATGCKEDEEGTIELKAPQTDSLLSSLWPAVEKDFERVAEQGRDSVDETRATSTAPTAIRRLPAAWTLPDAPPPVPGGEGGERLRREEAIEFEWATETARHVGTVVHRVLEQIGRDGIESWSPSRLAALAPWLRARLRALGVPGDELGTALEKVDRALTGTLNDERGRWILSSAHEDARCELALSGIHGGELVNVIIDRTFIDAAGVRWIIDYKTGSHAGGGLDAFLDQERERYRGQLERYAALMTAMEARPIRLALYFPLLGGWREWAYGEDRSP